jgi:hypothetical protein
MVGRDRIELSTQGFSVQLVSVRLRPSCKLALGFRLYRFHLRPCRWLSVHRLGCQRGCQRPELVQSFWVPYPEIP